MQAQSAQQVSMLQQSKLFAEQKAQAASDATKEMLMSVVQRSDEKLQAFQQKIEQQADLVEARRLAQEAVSAEVRAEAAEQAVRWAVEQQDVVHLAATQESMWDEGALTQQKAAAQEAAAQQAAIQQAVVQQVAAQQAAAQQAATQAQAHQQQQAQHGGQQWQQQHQCAGHNQMQGNASGGGEPPPQRGPVCTIC